MKPTVYIETTIPSYLTAWPSNNLLMAARQLSTKQWWDTREQYSLFVSLIVQNECRGGDPIAAALRLEAIDGLLLLDQPKEVDILAARIAKAIQLPSKAGADAFHLALSAFHGIDYLLTWNCKHIANASLRKKIEEICWGEGYQPPVMCTPDSLQLRLDHDE
jgi:predicted nucleic acid-binding protein